MTNRLDALLLTLLLAGCIVLPVPIPATGTRVDEAAPKLVVGQTTRAEVHALLARRTSRSAIAMSSGSWRGILPTWFSSSS